jgi:hypothetical protein
MSLIEKAAQRLEQLRRAGVEVAPVTTEPGAESAATAVTERVVSPERPASPEPAVQAGQAVLLADAPPKVAAPSSKPSANRTAVRPSPRQSKSVEIDLALARVAGCITPEADRSQIADEFRVMKRPIIRTRNGGSRSSGRGNCVMVTSALPSQGKNLRGHESGDEHCVGGRQHRAS